MLLAAEPGQLCHAQFAEDVQKLAADFLHDYAFLATGRVGSSIDLIIQHFEEVDSKGKKALLLQLVRAVEVNFTLKELLSERKTRDMVIL